MATVRVEYCGMDGEGKTLTAARQDAARKAEKAITGSYAPTILESRGWIILVWRDPNGWRESIIKDEEGVRKNSGYSSGVEYADAYHGALMSMAQMTWDGQEKYPPILEDIALRHPVKGSDGRRLLSDFDSWRGFQLAYKSPTAQALPENDRHRWACEHGHEFAA